MTAREMHYDFRQKLNKIDGQNNRNLKVPEIDWKLNEAQEMLLKIVAQPRSKSPFGFEVNQRTKDDVRTLVVNQSYDKNTCLIAKEFDSSSYVVDIPLDYMYGVSMHSYGLKDGYKTRLEIYLPEHDDEFIESPFDNSSFEWREVNATYFEDKIRIFTDSTFSITHLCLNYIKTPSKIHNAQDSQGGAYRDLGTNNLLTGFSNCILPKTSHQDIVDLAVLNTVSDLKYQDYQLKLNKFKLTN